MKFLLLFDVDGTITESGEKLKNSYINIINKIKNKHDIGIVGGGKFEKIIEQTNGVNFNYYFSECGSVYHDENHNLVYKKNIRKHSTYDKINYLIKLALKFLSQVEYNITGNFVDLRNGLIYISLIGLSANSEERKYFMDLDKIHNYRKTLLDILNEKSQELEIHDKVTILFGGSVGIAIFPIEYDKEQVINYIDTAPYSKIFYFGDKYLPDGNDYKLLNHANITPYNIDNVSQTYNILESLLES